jgi:hypothetical protein
LGTIFACLDPDLLTQLNSDPSEFDALPFHYLMLLAGAPQQLLRSSHAAWSHLGSTPDLLVFFYFFLFNLIPLVV